MDLLARERRLRSAYEAALRRDAIDASLGKALLAHERAHVDALERTLAGRGNPTATRPVAGAHRRARATDARSPLTRSGWRTRRSAPTPTACPRIRDPKLRQPLGSIMVLRRRARRGA